MSLKYNPVTGEFEETGKAKSKQKPTVIKDDNDDDSSGWGCLILIGIALLIFCFG